MTIEASNLEELLPDFLYGQGDRILLLQKVLKKLGNPDRRFLIIHVCGTNGKGSTSTMISSLLKEMGYKVGIFTSPHIVSITEHVKVSGHEIDSESFKECVKEINNALISLSLFPGTSISSFEMLFLISVVYFAKQKIDYAVLECGLGGELDATNSVNNVEYDIFTKIGFDHLDVLGNSIEEIVETKSEIIREGAYVIVAPNQLKETLTIIQQKCEDRAADFIRSENIIVKEIEKNPENDKLLIKGIGRKEIQLNFSSKGLYQRENLQTVLTWYRHFAYNKKLEFSEKLLNDALGKFSFVGRFETISYHPLIILDAAHNVDGINSFIQTVQYRYADYKKVFLIGFLKDKEVSKCLDELIQLDGTFVTTEPNHSDRKLASKELYDKLVSKIANNREVKEYKNPKRAIEQMINHANANEKKAIFVVGSFYLLSEVRKYILQNKENLNENKDSK